MSFRRFKKTLIISVLFIFTIAFLIYWLYPDADPRPVCNLNEYTVITESGRDGVGTLEITVDYETILSGIVDFAQKFDGVLGSRMTGAGFGGCTVTLIEEGEVPAFIQQLQSAYEQKFALQADCYIADIGSGAREF